MQSRKTIAKQIELNFFKSMQDKIGEITPANICMLGAVVGLTKIIKSESVVKSIENNFRTNYIQMNKKAFEIGLDLVKDIDMKYWYLYKVKILKLEYASFKEIQLIEHLVLEV